MYNQPTKMNKKKIIELTLLIVGILWFVLLGINYVRYTKSQGLILAIKSHSDYADGFVDEYISLGYHESDDVGNIINFLEKLPGVGNI